MFRTVEEMADEIIRLRGVMRHWANRADTSRDLSVRLSSEEIRREIQPNA